MFKIKYRLVISLALFLSASIGFGQTKLLDSLKSVLKTEKNDTTKINILNALIDNTVEENIWSQYNLQIKVIVEKNINQKLSPQLLHFYKKYLGITYNNTAYMDAQKGNIKEAIANYTKAKLIFEEINFPLGLAENFNNMAVILDNQGKISEALEMHAKSITIMKKLNDEDGIARSYNNIGMILKKQGSLVKAIDYFTKSLQLKEKAGNKNGMAYSLNNLGGVYELQDENEKAMQYYTKSLNIWLEINNQDGLYTAYNNIGGMFLKSKDNTSARNYYLKALKISTELGNMEGKAMSLCNLGQLAYMQNNFDTALVYLSKSKILFDSLNEKDFLSSVKNAISDTYFKQKKYKQAEVVALESLKISSEMGFPENIRDAAKILKNIYTNTAQYQKALEMSNLYLKMKDSLSKMDAKTANIKRHFKYEFDLKATADSLKNVSIVYQEKIKHEEEIKQQRFYTYGGIIGFALMMAIAILSFKAYKTKQKANLIIHAQKIEVEKQKEIIEEKQKEILDSINYAKRIQYTLLANDEFLKQNLDDHFVLFKPKDIVSGDFYWAASVGSSELGVKRADIDSSETRTSNSNLFFLAVCDSTGHGVPGAFMSLLNIGFLSEAIKEKGITKPNEVLNYVRQRLVDNINKEGQKDGFDGIILCMDSSSKTNTNKITYAAANNKPIIIQNNQLTELVTDKMPVGLGERKEDFKLNTIEVDKGAMIYLYTDGYADQFGGEKGKKFKYKPLNELLLTIHHLPLNQQRDILDNTFTKWKGNLEQVDDVCIVGIRV